MEEVLYIDVESFVESQQHFVLKDVEKHINRKCNLLEKGYSGLNETKSSKIMYTTTDLLNDIACRLKIAQVSGDKQYIINDQSIAEVPFYNNDSGLINSRLDILKKIPFSKKEAIVPELNKCGFKTKVDFNSESITVEL